MLRSADVSFPAVSSTPMFSRPTALPANCWVSNGAKLLWQVQLGMAKFLIQFAVVGSSHGREWRDLGPDKLKLSW